MKILIGAKLKNSEVSEVRRRLYSNKPSQYTRVLFLIFLIVTILSPETLL